MHVNVKKLVYAGLCLAISMVLILLEGVFGMSTLFLLSLSGFFAGIVIRESGFKMGAAYINLCSGGNLYIRKGRYMGIACKKRN